MTCARLLSSERASKLQHHVRQLLSFLEGPGSQEEPAIVKEWHVWLCVQLISVIFVILK